MPHTIKEKIRKWSRSTDDNVDFYEIHQQIEHLADNIFHEYEPCLGANQLEFRYRLRDWINSAPLESDQKILFQLIPFLFFIGGNEFNSLYETALNGPIARWLVDKLNIYIDDNQARNKIIDAVKSTWFCGITDSCIISKFYHINRLEGTDIRSDWRSLQKSNSINWIKQHLIDRSFKRIVLLEDFVGSGSQITSAINFSSDLSATIPILVCPLVICPKGVENINNIINQFDNVSLEPVLELSKSLFLSENSIPGEPQIYESVRELAKRLHTLVSGTGWTQDYGPFGFRETGGLTIMYSNCPDNTLPLIHHDSDSSWSALFPRSSRLQQ